jgi:hypothetical protein
MRLLAFVAIVALLSACETFTGPKTRDCHWRYTRFEWRWDTIQNQVPGGPSLVIYHEVPTDSVQECRPRS